MNDHERLDAAFRKALDVPAATEVSEFAYGSRAEWDSIGHLQLVAAIEETFKIAIASGDVVDMIDHASVRNVLRERYGLDC